MSKLDHASILAIFDQEQRHAVTYTDATREELPHLVRHTAILPSEIGFVTYSKLNDANADRAIDEQLAYFSALGQSLEWKVFGHDQPATLAQRLLARGFVQDEAESVMVLDLEDAPALLRELPTADVRRITEPSGIDDLVAVEEAVWQRDYSSLSSRLRNDLMTVPRELSVYIAYLDNAPVSTAWIYFHLGSQFASLWGGSTMFHARRRGLYSQLLAIRCREAQARGFRFLTVDASNMSRPILAKHGFRFLTTATGYLWQPQESDGAPGTLSELETN